MVSLAYDRQGSGPPLVLLHGLGHRRQAWDPVVPLLVARHEVVTVDLPGFGASPACGGARWREDLSTAVAAFIADLGLDRPHVAGNSLGGALALELAAAGQVASATALAPAGFWLTWERRWALALLHTVRSVAFLPDPVLRAAAGSPRVRALAYGLLVGRPDRLTAEVVLADALAMRSGSAFRAVARHGRDYAPNATPRCPVTVGWGTRDRLLLHRQAARARALLPGAWHVDLPGCGHSPMNDDPELVASVICQTTGTEVRR
ncbi:Pimeloyl-ACP methyl ester carboxylesterase [Actinopolymorpha cephalotaxi]|uniref:Pimeloyl-ACP methyl ester carboxylesterase n=1 Tax=Actinopolymorpha cephalotaxi TaxID=504797 RepID=A0A1I2PCR5_9ACTN|nr:alpha/beta fold hydrolase [Actinopolymorpha cephalotaxi]NYH83741.1 pimeloyl-ACP methyl ester carboxylesterase [Actinopolymorpha cephalotaxi]SFG11466.1 Pimeloyl-ACP methyl ester carboxylesterase [Actinopolymorpha cephalotaxi]